jgi:hypothetical protein
MLQLLGVAPKTNRFVRLAGSLLYMFNFYSLRLWSAAVLPDFMFAYAFLPNCSSSPATTRKEIVDPNPRPIVTNTSFSIANLRYGQAWARTINQAEGSLTATVINWRE